MKRIGVIILLAAIILQGFSRKLQAKSQDTIKQESSSKNDRNTRISIGDNLMSFEENDSALNMRVGNRGLSVLESLEGEGSRFHFEKYQDQDEWDERDDERARRRSRFKGHWAGIELGLNNYLTSDNSTTLPDNIDYMSLHSGKSTNFNINFAQLSLGLSRHIGFVTGLGLNWNNYRFNGNNNITKGENGVIEELDPGVPLKKSKLTTLYLDLPFLLEVQIPVDNSHLNIAAGPIGALKVGSHSKMVLEDGQKVKSNGDFSLNMMRYGATARVGFKNLHIYGTYYMTPLFQTSKAPAGNELHPFELGLAFTFND
jgi:hypothetical protein